MAKKWQNGKKLAKWQKNGKIFRNWQKNGKMAKKWQNFKKITHLINIYNNNNLINNILELY